MHWPFPSSTGPLSTVKKERIIYNAVEMVFQVGAFSDAAVFGIACSILIRFDFTWVSFSPRDHYHTGLYSHWTFILFNLLLGNHFLTRDSKKAERRCCGFDAQRLATYQAYQVRECFFHKIIFLNSTLYIFDEYTTLSAPNANKSNNELFVLISTNYREKCTVYMPLK